MLPSEKVALAREPVLGTERSFLPYWILTVNLVLLTAVLVKEWLWVSVPLYPGLEI